jgi:CubicO group peptidase (beta-lactamase class C family)
MLEKGRLLVSLLIVALALTIASPSTAGSQDSNPAELQAKINEYLAPWLQMGSFSGVILIAKGDEVLFQQGYGFADFEKKIPNEPGTKFLIGSLWKQFVATAIIKLQEEGKLSTDDPVSKYLPGYINGNRMTVHQLLCHTSGLPMDLTIASGDEQTPFKDLLNREPLLFEPGTQYNYSNVGYQILYLIIYAATGENPDDHIRRVIFDTLGMKDTGLCQGGGCDAIAGLSKGYLIEYRGLQDISKLNPWQAVAGYSTAADLLLWVRGLLDGKIVGADSLKRMLTPNLNGYGYAWFIEDHGGQTLIHHGGRMPGHRCTLQHLLEQDVTIIVLCNIGNFPRTRISADLLAIALGEPYVIPKAYTARSFDRRLLGAYAGVYEADDGSLITVYSASDHLFFCEAPKDYQGDTSGLPHFAMFPFSNDRFFCKEIDCQLEFNSDAYGNVRSLKLTYNGDVWNYQRK